MHPPYHLIARQALSLRDSMSLGGHGGDEGQCGNRTGDDDQLKASH
jgi:hypothetical protein